MKKLFLILFIFAFTMLCFSQQIDTTVVGDEIIITETPSEIQPVVRKFNIMGMRKQYKAAESHMKYYQAIMDKLEWAVEYKPEVVVGEMSTESITIKKMFIEKPLLGKRIYKLADNGRKDTKELLEGLSPIETKTYWRKATIKTWMDVRGVEYKSRGTNIVLIKKVKKYIEEK